MLKKFLITILVIYNSGILLAVYTPDSLLLFAENEYNSGNYELAIKELLRISYFQDGSDADILMLLADCYYQKGDWSTARQYYDQVYRITREENKLFAAKLKKISSLVLETNYKQALIDLYSIHDTLYQKHFVEIDLLFAICHFGLEEFDQSKKYFKHAVGNNVDAKEKIDSIFSVKKMFKRPHPGFAYTLSIIIPGLGQIYSGDVSEGLNSFFLTEAFLVLGLIVSYEYSIMDAIVSILPWYQRYYMGGLTNTWEVAVDKRQIRRSEAYKQVLDIVQEAQE